MPQHELTDALVAHMRKPGDPPLNPTGRHESAPARLTRLEFNRMLWRRANMPCEDDPSKTNLEVICDGLIREAKATKQWATKEFFNRLVGRVPFALDMSLTNDTSAPDETMPELLVRLDRLKAEALEIVREREAREAAIDVEVTLPNSEASVPDVTQPVDPRIAEEDDTCAKPTPSTTPENAE